VAFSTSGARFSRPADSQEPCRSSPSSHPSKQTSHGNPELPAASFAELGASKTVKWVVIGCLSVVATLESIAWLQFGRYKLGLGAKEEGGGSGGRGGEIQTEEAGEK